MLNHLDTSLPELMNLLIALEYTCIEENVAFINFPHYSRLNDVSIIHFNTDMLVDWNERKENGIVRDTFSAMKDAC